MPRAPRVIDPGGGTYHVICRGNNRANIFYDEEDFERYLEILLHYKKVIPFNLHHFAFLNNHVHLLLSLSPRPSLSEIMKRINYAYSRHTKKKYDFVGQLWQGRFKSHLISNDQYLLTCGIYVELNPVRAGIVKDPSDYRWSSCVSYTGSGNQSFITPDPSYLSLGRSEHERRIAYAVLIQMWQAHPVSKEKARKFFKNTSTAIHPTLS